MHHGVLERFVVKFGSAQGGEWKVYPGAVGNRDGGVRTGAGKKHMLIGRALDWCLSLGGSHGNVRAIKDASKEIPQQTSA